MPSLWTKSNFSFLHGASFPEELVAQAASGGHAAVAITDRHGLYGVVRAHRMAQQLGVKLIVGAEAQPRQGGPLVLLAGDAAAYAALCQLLSQAQMGHPKGEAALDLEALCTALAECPALMCLCPDPQLLPRLAAAGSNNVYALCARAQLPHEPAQEAVLVAAAQTAGVAVVAAVEVLYHVAERRALQDVFTCIRHGTTLEAAGTVLRANAEHALPSRARMAALFADRPEWLAAADAVAQRCSFSMASLRYRYPAGRLPPGTTIAEHLRARTMAGAARRYPAGVPDVVRDKIEHEIEIIVALDYAGYFLSMEEIVQFCRSQGILCQGRGSAANSAVCFCLGITAVDPARLDTLFERFLSKERKEPPDIDLDIEHQRREEVIQWVYATYGRRHAAMVANVVRYRMRSAVRQVGGVLGFAPAQMDALARQVGHSQAPGQSMAPGNMGFAEPIAWAPWLEAAGLDAAEPRVQHLMRLVMAVQDMPRHLSVHPGGFILGHAPVDTLCAVEPASMPGRTVVQWDKQDIEDLGLFKVDLLGLGALTQIHEALRWVARTSGEQLEMATVPHEDPATYAMIQRAETLGVFQIESRAQMAMLPRLRPETFYDLVVEVAIVRPGPIQGDMVHPYLRQRASGRRPSYPHPAFAAILDKTYGVPIFQEQVMRLAILAAGYSPDEADQLRRDMAAWRSQERLEAHHARIIAGMVAHGVPETFAERIFAQIRGFGEYGFPESHAASFAHIVYVTAYLRCHHPEAFTCALLNAQPMGFYSPATVVHEAQRRGLAILPVDIQYSAWDCTVVPHPAGGGWAVRMGLRFVRGLGVREAAALAAAPAPYADLADLVQRTGLHRGALLTLARAGALDGLYAGLHRPAPARRRALVAMVLGSLAGRHDGLALPPAEPQGADEGAAPWARPLPLAEQILWERHASSHSTRGHPLGPSRPSLQRAGALSARVVGAMGDGQQVRHVGLIICLQRPQTAGGVTFLTLEDETGFVNAVLWRDVFARYAAIIKRTPVIAVTGRIQRAGEVVHLVAQHVEAPPPGHPLWDLGR